MISYVIDSTPGGYCFSFEHSEGYPEYMDIDDPDTPETLYRYARNVLKARWFEAEPVIMKEPEWAYYYACHVLKARWREAEPVIMKDPCWAYLYSFKARWLEAEP